MNDNTSDPVWSIRDELAKLGTSLNSVLAEGSPVLPLGFVNAFRKEVEGLPAFAKLMDYEQRLWQAFVSFDPPSGNLERENALVALGWLTTTFHQVHAAFQLAASGLPVVGVANVRAAAEHALYLSALVNPEDSNAMLHNIEHRHLKGLKRVREFASKRNLLGDQILMEVLLTMMPTETNQEPTITWPEKIEQVSNRLTDGSQLYLEYRNLSAWVHPGIYSILFSALFDHTGTVDPRPQDADDASLVGLVTRRPFWLAIGACAWAGWAADQVFATHHFGPLLAEFADELGFAPIFKKLQCDEGI